jgi:methyl-accepting chemotaxis protein
VIIPFIIYNILSYYIVSHNIEDKMRENNRMLTLSTAQNIKTFAEKFYVLTKEMSINNDIISFDPEKQQRTLVGVAKRNPELELLYVQKTDGWQTANSLGAPPSDRSHRWWFEKFMNLQESFVSKSYYSTTTNTTVTSLFLPIQDRSGKIIGIMGADLHLTAIQELVKELSVSSSSFTYVIDGEGTVIAHPDVTQVAELYNYKTATKTTLITNSQGIPLRNPQNNHITLEQSILIPHALQDITLRVLHGEVGTQEYKDLDGNDMICTYAPVILPGKSDYWAVITIENKNKVMAVANQIIGKNLLVGCVVLVLAFVAILLISGRITKPILAIDKQINKVSSGNIYDPIQGDFGHNEISRVANSFEAMRAKLAAFHTEREQTFLSIIEALVIALESKDDYTHAHSVEVAEIAAKVSQELGLTEHEQFNIKFAALLHDIGKIGIPDYVLNKQAALTEEEWGKMCQHPVIGAKIIRTIPKMNDIADMVCYHHERWDGKGYPSLLAGEDIKLGSRIISVADTFQAMTSDRPYRKAMPKEQAIDEICRCAGTQFDKKVVEAFLRIYTSIGHSALIQSRR